MQNRIGRRQNPLGLYLTSRRTKEGQELGSASAHILVWLSGWLARWVPGFSWVGNRLIGTSLAPFTTTGSLLSPPAHKPVRSGFVFPGLWDHARSLLLPCVCVQLCRSDTRCGFYQIDIQLYITSGERFLSRCVTIQPCAKRCRVSRATRWPSDQPLDLVLAALLAQCACVVQPCKWVCAHAPLAISNARSPRWLKRWTSWLTLSPLLYPASRAAAVNARPS